MMFSTARHANGTAHTIASVGALLSASMSEVSVRDREVEIRGVNTIQDAQRGELTFLANPKYAQYLTTTKASCVLVAQDFDADEILALSSVPPLLLRVENPQAAFALVLAEYAPDTSMEAGFRDSTAVIHASAEVHESAHIGAHVSIGAGCTVGAGAVLHAGVRLYAGVSIGAGSVLHSNVVCYHQTSIGAGCVIHAGAVLGADGFGFAEQKDGSFTKIPQIGNVVVEDDVEIGANCTIDRAALGSTRIGRGVKIDNLVHIAHNVHIGDNTAIAAQAGVSGSTTLGARNRVAGQVGFVGHITTADDVVVFAQSGVSKSLPERGIYFGYPARPHRESLRIEAALRNLPELAKEVERLKRELAQMQALVANKTVANKTE
jgi:UDP-3-O-[3-hydroxymyristoyl] glucosamine N-acyltransferase